MLSKKEGSAKLIDMFSSSFRCPICEDSFNIVNLSSAVCKNNHTFDVARQGYINFLTRPVKSNYGKSLFEARNHIITKSALYSPMHKAVASIIDDLPGMTKPPLIADLGCGEGSHLQAILQYSKIDNAQGVGLDIAKEGILLAAKHYAETIWFVGDLAKSPFANNSFPIILNILSPANYNEFNRIITEEGFIIKIVPRPHYLKELREALYTDNNDYDNEQTVSLFEEHFQLLKSERIKHTQTLSKHELTHLVQMTPLSWSATQTNIDSFIQQNSTEITIDLDILVGVKK